MSANMSDNGTSVYLDPRIEVKVNVDPTKEMEFDYHRDPSCIKITAASSNAHFIQFVTRQYPDIYEYRQSQGATIQWESVAPFYMTDTINPKWKLDITEDSASCFYEEGGLNQKSDNSISMYDDPSGAFIPDEDRATFCTFIMIENKITHMVQWSKQSVIIPESEEPISCYLVKVNPWTDKPLPSWAFKIVADHYKSKGVAVPKEIADDKAIKELSALTVEGLKAESRQNFLPPPDNWCTFKNYPKLREQFIRESEALKAPSGLMFQYPMSDISNLKDDAMSLVEELKDVVKNNKVSFKALVDYYENTKSNPLLSNIHREFVFVGLSPMSEQNLAGTIKEYHNLISKTQDKTELRHAITSLDKLINQEARKKPEMQKTLASWSDEDRDILKKSRNLQ